MPWLGQPWRLHQARVKSLPPDPVKLRAGGEIADFESEQAVDIHEAQRAFAIDRERPDGRAERARLP